MTERAREKADKNGWRPIKTLQDAMLDHECEDTFLVWNPCDGAHLMCSVSCKPWDFDYGAHAGIYTHWKNVGPGPETKE